MYNFVLTFILKNIILLHGTRTQNRNSSTILARWYYDVDVDGSSGYCLCIGTPILVGGMGIPPTI